MDELFTPELKINKKEICSLLGDELSVSPKESTIDFIKSFARNFRVARDVDNSLQGFILN